MTNKELHEYLSKFEEDSDIAIIAVNREKRKVYQHGVTAVTDLEIPVFILEITGERDMNKKEQDCFRQPELPELKNNTQRKEFLSSFHNWPIWFSVPEADEIYYKYDLPDGSSIVICEYKQYLRHLKEYRMDPERKFTKSYLLEPRYHHLHDCEISQSLLIEHLKEIQKLSK